MTCFRVNGEEVLRIACTDSITETIGHSRQIRVLRLDADNGNIFWWVLHDNRMVDGIRRQWGIVINIFHLREKISLHKDVYMIDIKIFPYNTFKLAFHIGFAQHLRSVINHKMEVYLPENVTDIIR